MSDKLLQSQCRQIIQNYEGAVDAIIAEIEREMDKTRIEGDNAFEYAKGTIRRQAVKEGLTMFKQKLSRHASRQ